MKLDHIEIRPSYLNEFEGSNATKPTEEAIQQAVKDKGYAVKKIEDCGWDEMFKRWNFGGKLS